MYYFCYYKFKIVLFCYLKKNYCTILRSGASWNIKKKIMDTVDSNTFMHTFTIRYFLILFTPLIYKFSYLSPFKIICIILKIFSHQQVKLRFNIRVQFLLMIRNKYVVLTSLNIFFLFL